MRIEVKTADRTALEKIAALEEMTFSSPWRLADLAVMLERNDRELLCAYADGDFAGYIGAYTVARESDVTTLAVLPALRGRGIGKALLEALLRALAGKSDALFLEVRQSNAAARALYEKLGFHQTGIRRGYYQKPTEDAILYQKEL